MADMLAVNLVDYLVSQRAHMWAEWMEWKLGYLKVDLMVGLKALR